MIKKTIIINRAVPGSGKTTITNCVVEELKSHNISVAVHSTDEYFMVKDRYIFELERLGEYHNNNLYEFKKSVKRGVQVVICDNTNIAPWQTEAYTELARKHNYQIVVITLDPREVEKHVASQKVTPQKPDAHEVSENILKTMIQEYYIYDDLLNPRIFIDEGKHLQYKWDTDSNSKSITGIAKHFDSDYIIRILPNEYKNIQKIIGTKILKLIEAQK